MCKAGQVKRWGMSFQADGRAFANQKSTWEQGKTSSNSVMELRVLKGVGVCDLQKDGIGEAAVTSQMTSVYCIFLQ